MDHARTASPADTDLAGASPARLRRHLVHDHHRSSLELAEATLAAVHRLEHTDAELGLLVLDHAHAGR